MFTSETTWNNEDIFVDVRVHGFESKVAAEAFGTQARMQLQHLVEAGRSRLVLSLKDGGQIELADPDVTVLYSQDRPEHAPFVYREDCIVVDVEICQLAGLVPAGTFGSMSYAAYPTDTLDQRYTSLYASRPTPSDDAC